MHNEPQKLCIFSGLLSRTVLLAIMLEYVFFDFKSFEVDKKVNSLFDLLNYLDKMNSVNMPEKELQAKICLDIVKGLKYLHSKDTAHRGLKTANVLVSNRHCCTI